jgi:hypothetical protein
MIDSSEKRDEVFLSSKTHEINHREGEGEGDKEISKENA